MIVCPAMNTAMWEHPITQQHLDQIKTFGPNVYVIPPIVKTLICGDHGMGAMEEPSVIAQRVADILTQKK